MATISGRDIQFVDRGFSENLLVVAGVRVFGAQLTTDGISSFTLDVPLARNALVRKYDIVINADRANATLVNAVAQVRATASTARHLGGRGMAIVLDFGTPRTISGVSVPSGMTIVQVTPWMGTAFGPQPVFTGGSQETAILPSEVRTERLLVEATGSKNGDELAAQMAVVLPEAPSDLEIRIDGGAPVVTLSGPAQPGPATALSDDAWNRDGERIVHLAEALGKLTGDPTRSEEVTFKVVLNSRVPGKLSMRLAEAPVLSYVRRVTFNGDASKELSFNEEGTEDVPLESLPAPLAIEEISFTAVGTLPPERIIPPVGPNDADLADLVLDSDRAVCVRLRSTTGLAELTGIRLPLRAGSGGAEIRVLFWKNKEGSSEPLEPMPGAVSEPVELAAGDKEAWTTFLFKKAVAITTQNPPWAVLTVSRGEVAYSLGASAGATDPQDQNVIKRGAPTGPFKPLPLLFQSGTSGFGLVRGRMRLIGHAPKDLPVAPLIVSIVSDESAVEVTPVAKGAFARLSFPPALAVSSPVLRAISRSPGNVTLRDIDVVSTT
jgi:hypothetical protein